MVVAKTEFDRIIVGYTPMPWNKEDGYVADRSETTFLLLLSQMEKLTLNKPEQAIQCLKSYGPVFGSGDLAICDHCNER
jgi:hypothetical protein